MKLPLLINVIVCFLAFCPLVFGYGSFPIKYKGSTLSVDDYHKLELCVNKFCIEDSNRILLEMSYNKSVDPCEDFNEFTCGTFFKERAYNERYAFIGYEENYKRTVQEKRNRILKAPINDNEPTTEKIMKTFHKQCINSREYRSTVKTIG